MRTACSLFAPSDSTAGAASGISPNLQLSSLYHNPARRIGTGSLREAMKFFCLATATGGNNKSLPLFLRYSQQRRPPLDCQTGPMFIIKSTTLSDKVPHSTYARITPAEWPT